MNTIVGKFTTSQKGEESSIEGGPYQGKILGAKP